MLSAWCAFLRPTYVRIVAARELARVFFPFSNRLETNNLFTIIDHCRYIFLEIYFERIFLHNLLRSVNILPYNFVIYF